MCSARENEMKLAELLTRKDKKVVCNLGRIIDIDGEEHILHPCEREGLQECSVQKYQQCYIWYREKWGCYE